MRKAPGSWVPVVGFLLALLLLVAVLFWPREPAPLAFELEEDQLYELHVTSEDGNRYTYQIEDQDARDLDRQQGSYEIRLPISAGDVLEHELAKLSPGSPIPWTDLPSQLPDSPFAGKKRPRAWASLGDLVRRFQSPSARERPGGSRVVELLPGGTRSVSPTCDALQVAVRPDGEFLAVVRPVKTQRDLEIWVRETSGLWTEQEKIQGLRPPVDPVWDHETGEGLWFLQAAPGEGALWRWSPLSRGEPELRAEIQSVTRLLTVVDGNQWLKGREEDEFVLRTRTGELYGFVADPSLEYLRSYLPRLDAFLILTPARRQESMELVLRDRLGDTSEILRELPETIRSVRASADLSTLIGIEVCDD